VIKLPVTGPAPALCLRHERAARPCRGWMIRPWIRRHVSPRWVASSRTGARSPPCWRPCRTWSSESPPLTLRLRTAGGARHARLPVEAPRKRRGHAWSRRWQPKPLVCGPPGSDASVCSGPDSYEQLSAVRRRQGTEARRADGLRRQPRPWAWGL